MVQLKDDLEQQGSSSYFSAELPIYHITFKGRVIDSEGKGGIERTEDF